MSPPTSPRKIRVYVCDDSAVARLVLRKLLTGDAAAADDFELVGESASSRGALREIPALAPDLVLMDVVMPAPDGLEVTRRLLDRQKVRILLVSDLAGVDSRLSFQALEAGALDLLSKPTRDDIADPRRAARWLRRLRRFAEVPMVTRTAPRSPPRGALRNDTPRSASSRRVPARTARSDDRVEGSTAARRPPDAISMLLVGTSTGGPPALLHLLRGLGPTPPWPVLVVQHITSGFTDGLGRWLSESLGREVRLSRAGELPRPGITYLAPDDAHLTVDRRGNLRLDDGPPRLGHRPSVDALFESVARTGAADRVCAALLTGMGSDGARGLLELRRAGAWTVAQDEETSVVYGMPKAAADLGAASEVLPLEKIARRIAAMGAV